jgi:predicted secreted protein with PEFG-CTERM motif
MFMKKIWLSIIIMSLSSFVTFSITDIGISHVAFAQQDTTDPTAPPTTGDNMTSGDNSPDTGNAPMPYDNSTGANNPGSPPDLGLPQNNMSGDVQPNQNSATQNMTTQGVTTQGVTTQGVTTQNMTVQPMTSQATPEFGPVAILVLIISVISIVFISYRSKLSFRN